MNHDKVPLLAALHTYQKASIASYHVPGHKSGRLPIIQEYPFFQQILALDQTEVGDLDDLHDPRGCIKEAQDLVADIYEAEQSFFLVNGSTVGNIAMIMATCQRGDKVLVQRNCHKSIIHGLMLVGVQPTFLPTVIDVAMELPLGVAMEKVKEAMKRDSYQAIILSNPNYYGHTMDLSSIVTAAHELGMPVLVDEAHGAHFCISNEFPTSALAYGADVVVHSAHKTLPAMTMGSYLHVNSKLVSKGNIAHYLQVLQSSSPSYPIMASLDMARKYLATLQKDGVGEILQQVERFHREIQSIAQLEIALPQANVQVDPLKITLRSTVGLTGYELQQRLESVGIYTELADPLHVLFILPLGMQDNIEEVFQKIREVAAGMKGQKQARERKAFPAFTSIFPYSYDELRKKEKQVVSFQEAIGKIAAQMVTPYPPGIPIIMDGEKIIEEMIQYIEELIDAKAYFQQGKEISAKKIMVYREEESS